MEINQLVSCLVRSMNHTNMHVFTQRCMYRHTHTHSTYISHHIGMDCWYISLIARFKINRLLSDVRRSVFLVGWLDRR
jgi:hypothetical protein